MLAGVFLLIQFVILSLDATLYLNFLTTQGRGLLGALNPANIIRYIATPAGIAMRVAIVATTPELLLLLAATLWLRKKR